MEIETTTVGKAHPKKRSNANDKVFQVKAKGYKETFKDYSTAKKKFDILKKRGIKNKESVSVQLIEDPHGSSVIIDEVKIDPDFYQE